MYSLPVRNVLLERIDSGAGNEERVVGLLRGIIQSGRPVYKVTQDLYDSYDIGDLP